MVISSATIEKGFAFRFRCKLIDVLEIYEVKHCFLAKMMKVIVVFGKMMKVIIIFGEFGENDSCFRRIWGK